MVCHNAKAAGFPFSIFVVVVLVSGLLGCAPQPITSPASGNPGLFPRWTSEPLPFLPVAINNAEVIIGNSNSLGVVRYFQGAFAGLPHINHAPGGGPYQAVDINTSGAILGIPDSASTPPYYAVTWSPPTFNPFPIGGPLVGYLVPQALNNSQVMIGWAGDAELAWKWTQIQGYTELKPHLPGFGARPTDINDSGFVTGYDYQTKSLSGKILLWWPDGSVTVVSDARALQGLPRIRNNGEVVWAEGDQINHWLAGNITSIAAPAGIESLNAVSNPGRLIGTLKTNGVMRGWTEDNAGHFSFLDPPNPQLPGDYLEPVGVNDCGSIVGIVRRTGNPDYGIYFKRSGIQFWCDTPPVATQ